jgi:two-component system, NarL family, nitrate/nitrite response regulator NarL
MALVEAGGRTHGALVPPSVLVVDDQLAVREGVARLLACAPIELRDIATAANASEAMLAAARLRPDVVVLDVDLAGEDGLALIACFSPGTRVLVLSCHGDPATRERAARLGACAFVEKHLPAAELLQTLAAITIPHAGGEECPGAGGASAHLGLGASSGSNSGPQI